MLQYIKSRIKEEKNFHNICRQYEVKLSRIRIKHARLTQRHLMSINNQQITRGNQRLAMKYCPQDCPRWRDSRKKNNIQGDIRTLLGKDCEVEKTMRFLKGIGIFEEI